MTEPVGSINILLDEFEEQSKIHEKTQNELSEQFQDIRSLESKIITFIVETYGLEPAACYSQGHPHYKTPKGKLIMLKPGSRGYSNKSWRERIEILEGKKDA